MPSAPKILKETILETAYGMLIRDGYETINIKTVAQELGCSTQPISRQFGNMDGFREELLDYCLFKFSAAFSVKGEKVADIVLGVAQGYINLAYDYPNVYKYLYMSDPDGEKKGDLARSLRSENYARVIKMLMEEYDVGFDTANDFMKDMEYYVHGIASYTVIGFVHKDKEELMARIADVRDVFLVQMQKEAGK